MSYYSVIDIPLFMFYMIIIFLFAWSYANKRLIQNRIYKYFIPGLMAHILGALVFCLIYTFHYEGGDTVNYHNSSNTLIHLLFKNPKHFFEVWLFDSSNKCHSYFDADTGYPLYLNKINAFNVVRLMVPIEMISLGSFLVSSTLLASITYIGSWKLYQLFTSLYPRLYKGFGFMILFMPSVLFWGCGILKDSFTFTAMCWLTYSFYHFFIKKERSFWYLICLFLSIMVLLMIKPYIFVALFPSILIWKLAMTIKRIPNLFMKVFIAPLILAVGVLIGIVIWSLMSSGLGKYSTLEGIVDKAYVSQNDLKQDYYNGNSFDIGEFDPTPLGMLSKFPSAITAGLFRPFIWESKNLVMFVSGLENLFFIIFFIITVLKSPYRFFNTIINQPPVLFCFIFVLIFSFAIGISTSNFGALVRFKIPLIPFFLCGLYIIYKSKELFSRE